MLRMRTCDELMLNGAGRWYSSYTIIINLDVDILTNTFFSKLAIITAQLPTMSFFQASIAFTHACDASGEGAKHSSEMKGSNCAIVRYRIQSIGRCTFRYLYLYHTVLTKAVYSLFFNYQSYLNFSVMYISTNDAFNICLSSVAWQ